MNQHFGPWATLIYAGRSPQLSAFWRQRLTRLPGLARAKPGVTSSAVGALIATAVALVALPTLSVRHVSAEPRRDQAAASSSVKPHTEHRPGARPITQVAVLHYGGGLAGEGGVCVTTGYTCLTTSDVHASKTEVAVSFAYEQGSLGRRKYRLVAMDKQQQIHEAIDEASVMGGGSKLCVMTLTAAFSLRERDIDEIIVQECRE